MSTWESVKLSPEDIGSIPEPKFSTIWRGYDPDEVKAYLKRLAGRMHVLEHNASELESELEQARKQKGSAPDEAARGEAFEKIAHDLADLLRSFDEDMRKMRTEGKAEADRIVAEAKAEADRIRVDAQTNAEEVRTEAERAAKEARAKADELLSGLESRRSSLLVEMRALKDRMLDAAKKMTPATDAEHPADGIVVEDEGVSVSETTGGEPESLSRGR
jgi:DivIVA domain-containing protein